MKGVTINSNGHLQIEFNSRGQPTGKESISLSSFLGPLVREIVPITIPDWRKVTKGMKEVLWKSVQARYKSNARTSKEAPSRVDVWTTAHKKKNGERVNSKVAEAFGLLEEYKKDTSETSTTAVKEDVLSKVLGLETSSYLRAYGRGVTQAKLAITSERDNHIIHLESQNVKS